MCLVVFTNNVAISLVCKIVLKPRFLRFVFQRATELKTKFLNLFAVPTLIYFTMLVIHASCFTFHSDQALKLATSESLQFLLLLSWLIIYFSIS